MVICKPSVILLPEMQVLLAIPRCVSSIRKRLYCAGSDSGPRVAKLFCCRYARMRPPLLSSRQSTFHADLRKLELDSVSDLLLCILVHLFRTFCTHCMGRYAIQKRRHNRHTPYGSVHHVWTAACRGITYTGPFSLLLGAYGTNKGNKELGAFLLGAYGTKFLVVIAITILQFLLHNLGRQERYIAKYCAIHLMTVFQVCFLFEMCVPSTYTLIWTIIFFSLASVFFLVSVFDRR